MSLEHLVLGLLVQAPAHGYSLCARVNEQLCELRPVHPSHVYAALGRLERGGLAVAHTEREQRRTHRVFSVTAAGTAAHRAWRARGDRGRSPLRRPLLVKAALLAMLGEQQGPRLLRAERTARERLLGELRALPPAATIACLLRERARRHLEVELWLLESSF